MNEPTSRAGIVRRIWSTVACGTVVCAGALIGCVPAEASERPSPAPATTDDTRDLEALLGESVVTTASRSAERASVAPATVFNIGAAEMMRAGIRSVDEALEFLGLGIYVNNVRDYATGSDVGAQGVLLRDAGQHVLVLLNGTILNSQGTGRISVNEALGVPLESIDHIEVMLGPGSVMYGSNAMLAVINIVTKPAKELAGVHASAELGSATPMDEHGRIVSGGDTNFGLRYRLAVDAGVRFHFAHTDGEVTAMLELTHETTNSYAVTPFGRDPNGNQSFLRNQTLWGGSVFNTMRAPSGIVVLKLGQFRLMLNAFDYIRSTPLTGTLEDPMSRERQDGARLELRYDWDINSKLTFISRLYGGYASFSESSNYGESYWCVSGENNGCAFKMSAASEWVGLEQQLSVNWLASGKVKTIFGYDARVRLFDSRPGDYHDLITGAAPTDIALPHVTNDSFVGALFVEQVWQATRWLSINAGGRLDIDSEFGARFSPRAAVVATPTETTVIRASYNEAFRAPSAYELFEQDPTYRIAATSLRPETVRSVELELQQRVWRFQLAVRGYVSLYQDFIDSRAATTAELSAHAKELTASANLANVVINDNLDALHVYGGSASLQLHLPRGFELAYTLNLARTEHPNGVVDQRLPLWFGNFRAGWQSGEEGYSLMLVGVYTSAREILFNSLPQNLPPLGSRVDLRLTGAGPLGHIAGLTWRASVGGSLQWEQPYAVALGPPLPNGYVLYPIQTRLFGFVGIRYQFADF